MKFSPIIRLARRSLLMLLFIPMILSAQTTGKIAGKVVDAETGEPLVGANVVIEGTNRGAATASDGSYFIINLAPGSYTVKLMMIGYETMIQKDVRVSVNRTTEVNAKLKVTVLQGQEVVVTASQVEIKKDQTSSVRNVTADDMKILPIENTGGIVALQPGVVSGHVRGGRSNETSYLVDGISIYNGYDRSQSIAVDPEALEEIEVITGTFHAKYGEAMAGVVNMVTKEGGNQFHGKLETYLENYYTAHRDVFIGLKPEEIDRNRDFKFYLHGPILKNRLSFFISARASDFLNHLNGIRRFNITDLPDYSHWQDANAFDKNGQYLFQQHTGDGAIVPMNWYQGFTATGKLTYQLHRLKMSLSYFADQNRHQDYNHAFKYKPDGRNIIYNDNYMLLYQLNHFLSPRAFYELKFSYSNSYNADYLYENPTDPRYVHDRYAANYSYTGFYTGGQQKDHRRTRSEKLLGRLDFTWQMNSTNSIEAGAEGALLRYDNRYYQIQNKYRNSSASGLFYEPEVLPDSTAYADVYRKQPFQIAAYLSDKMEYKDMVLTLGARLEYFDPQTHYPSNYRNPGNLLAKEDQPEWQSVYLDADAKINVAPRLGFSYKLGETALLRFSYGHFFQYPPHSTMYLNNSYVLSTDNYASTIGNPQVHPEKTVNYELGLWQVLNDNMDLEVAIWYKDIYELSTVNIVTTYNGIRYGLYGNKDYGNARGLEVKYHTRFGRLYTELNYTLQYTRGNADNSRFTFDRAGNNQDPIPTLIPMSWDQRHTLNATVGYNTDRYGLTATAYWGSGGAFTWTPIDQNPLNRVNLFPNNGHKPMHYSIDARAFYDLPTRWGMKLRWSIYVYNLLDRLNEENVDGHTGRTNQAIIRDSDRLEHWSDFSSYEERIYSPSNWSAPRSIKLGLGLVF